MFGLAIGQVWKAHGKIMRITDIGVRWVSVQFGEWRAGVFFSSNPERLALLKADRFSSAAGFYRIE